MNNPLSKIEDFNIKIYKQVLDGTLPKFPRNFWKEEYESAPAIVRYLIEDVLQWNEQDIKENFSIKTLQDNKLSGLLKYVYKNTIFDVIEDAYPYRFYPWELNSVPNNYWHDIENCINATRWLILEKLKWTREDIVKNFNGKTLSKNGMTGLLKWGWNGESLRAITLSFPEYNIKPWELLSITLNNLTKEEGAEAIRWFIEDKMFWSEEDIKSKWRSRDLRESGILRIIVTLFDNNMFDAINFTYPNRFKVWDFPVPNNYWSLENSKEALRWLILEKLKITPEEALQTFTRETLREHKLIQMLDLGFKTNIKNAIRITF